MGAGRPTEYPGDVEAMAVIERYIDLCKASNYLPTAEGLAVEFGVGRSTLYRWRDANNEFRDTLEVMLTLQGSMLIQNGLVNNYNSTITKLMLASNHGIVDKQQTDITSGGEKLTIQPILYGETTVAASVQSEAVSTQSTQGA